MTEKKPSVTVIVPTFNRAHVLKYSIQTVLHQDFQNFEAWIVGDGCTDNSEAVVSAFGDHRLNWLNLPENTGSPSIPRSEAIQRARGRFIAYLGHDDLWFPWHLSHLIRHQESTDADFVFSLGALLKPGGHTELFSLPEKSRNPIWKVSPSNWFHRIELIDQAGGWPSKKIWASDMLFLRNIWETKARLSFTRTLSVIKFTASSWGMYSIDSRFPQEKYAKSLLKDPESLRLDILQDAAANMALIRKGLSKKETFLRAQLRKMIMLFFNYYGIQRWPVNQILKRRWQKKSGLT